MRIDYLKAKRTRLYEEGRLAKGRSRKRRDIDVQLRKIEQDLEKAEKEKAKE
jgi:hypothetical protein